MKNLKQNFVGKVDKLTGILNSNNKYDENLMFEVAKKKASLKIVESYDEKF